MNSRERVLATINHQEPDKMPIDIGAMRSTGVMAIAYAKVKKKLGIQSGRVRVYDVMQQLAEIEPAILERFQVDVVDIVNTSLAPMRQAWKTYLLPDGTEAEVPPDHYFESDGKEGWFATNAMGERWGRMPKGCLYFEPISPPIGAPRKAAEEYRVPTWTDEALIQYQENARYLAHHTEYALFAGFGGNILENGQLLRGWGNFMMDLADGSGFADEFIDSLVEQHLHNLKAFLAAVGDSIHIIQMGDDLGTQSGPQVSLDMFRRFILPAYKKVYGYVKEHYPHIKLFLHSCGSIEIYINDLIEVGVDILNPVQTSAKNMDPQKLKDTYGDRITFWGGGCDTQSMLPNCTPQEIEAHVKERIAIFAPGGGYVFTPVHNIQADVPVENIIALYDAAIQARECYGAK
jgi:uroporphyrinogen decarboxylase